MSEQRRGTIQPGFWSTLYGQGLSRPVLVALAKDIPNLDVFEACRRGEITPEYAAELLMAKREAEPWLVRFIRWLFVL